ncbi:4277_t:CDS:1 [Ambispora gerdemannii]|uniref:4277_t:CDS:1 n=1 Tax=Ambispora gerdemannii TaxID=144530 RepID=A0A9N8YPN1_9GLOM|nr:4277_t:CDS:1 [Ambispora gerdemannii]
MYFSKNLLILFAATFSLFIAFSSNDHNRVSAHPVTKNPNPNHHNHHHKHNIKPHTRLPINVKSTTSFKPKTTKSSKPKIVTRGATALGIAPLYNPNNKAANGHQVFFNNPATNIDYHQGEVMSGLTNIHFIYYGDWNNQDERNILQTFFENVDGTPWFQTLQKYSNLVNKNITGPIKLTHVLTNEYTHGSSLTKQNHIDIVNEALDQNILPEESNAIYFILSSKDVRSEGFCKDYCGYHSHFTRPSNTQLIYSYVGNAEEQCASGCATGNPNISPNSNVGVDGMINIMAHELIESMNDPFLSAWYDSNGQESADKCNFNFGKTAKAENNADYNMIVNDIKYNIQMNWNPITAECDIGS